MNMSCILLCFLSVPAFSAAPDKPDKYDSWFHGGEEPASSFTKPYFEGRLGEVGAIQTLLVNREDKSEKRGKGGPLLDTNRLVTSLKKFRELAMDDGFLPADFYRKLVDLCTRCFETQSSKLDAKIKQQSEEFSELFALIAEALKEKQKSARKVDRSR